MELHHIRYFLKLAETLHFTQASDELFITQPALSQQIKQLEDELGVLLFERSGRKIILTDAGKIFQEYAQNAINEVLKGEQAMSDLKKEINGSVNVGVMYSYSTPLLSILGDFCKSYPGVRINLQYGNNKEILELLLQSKLDIALMFDNTPSESVTVKGSFNAHLKMAVSTKHKFAKRSKISLLELKNTLLALLVPGNIIRTIVEESFRQYKTWPFINTELSDIHLLLDLVERGDFATVITDTATLNRENIALIPIEEELPVIKGVVLVKKNSKMSKASTLFLDTILGQLSHLSLGEATT